MRRRCWHELGALHCPCGNRIANEGCTGGASPRRSSIGVHTRGQGLRSSVDSARHRQRPRRMRGRAGRSGCSKWRVWVFPAWRAASAGPAAGREVLAGFETLPTPLCGREEMRCRTEARARLSTPARALGPPRSAHWARASSPGPAWSTNTLSSWRAKRPPPHLRGRQAPVHSVYFVLY